MNDITDRNAQIAWLDQNVVNFIVNGGAGHYDPDDDRYSPEQLALYMVAAWVQATPADDLPVWWSESDVNYSIARIAESLQDQRDQAG